MPYDVTKTTLPGVLILTPRVYNDNRGYFFESFNQRDFVAATEVDALFVQDNHSYSHRGVLRGLHYQVEKPQGKLVRVIEGDVFDVAVDIRPDSPTYQKWVGVTLSADNRRQLWIPPGFAHGFLVTSSIAQVLYKTTEYWYPENERTLVWNDPTVNIKWPDLDTEIVLSKKDQHAT
jgi:dTDP-4-dehydrorhamnose 3,5-epimerase